MRCFQPIRVFNFKSELSCCRTGHGLLCSMPTGSTAGKTILMMLWPRWLPQSATPNQPQRQKNSMSAEVCRLGLMLTDSIALVCRHFVNYAEKLQDVVYSRCRCSRRHKEKRAEKLKKCKKLVVLFLKSARFFELSNRLFRGC